MFNSASKSQPGQIGTVTVNGKRRPRIWVFSILAELSPDTTPAQRARLQQIEKRINRLTCESPRATAALIRGEGGAQTIGIESIAWEGGGCGWLPPVRFPRFATTKNAGDGPRRFRRVRG